MGNEQFELVDCSGVPMRFEVFKRYNGKTSFTLLAYVFELRVLKSNKTGKLGRACRAGALRKAMKETIRTNRSCRPHRGTVDDTK